MTNSIWNFGIGSGLARLLGCAALVAMAATPGMSGAAEKPDSIKVAVVHFMSGAAAPHDAAAVNTARLLVDQFNGDGGIGGVRIDAIFVDEAGSTAEKVAEYRRLVQDEEADVVIGYTSSSHCLGIAPVAEELRTLTIFPICANYRLFEEADYDYVFRTSSHAAAENVSAALYVLEKVPDLKTIAGLNYDYAYGRDSWEMFRDAILKLKPDVEVVGELWVKFLATEYSAEISRLLAAKPDVIHTVNWGAGLSALNKHGRTRGLFDQSLLVATTGLLQQAKDFPEGVAFSGRGYHLQHPDPSKNVANRDFIRAYRERFGEPPDYTGHYMASAFHALKAAYEDAMQSVGGWPTTEDVTAAMTDLSYNSPVGRVHVRKDHQAVHSAAWGLTTGEVDPELGYPVLSEFKVFLADRVNPPLGTKSVDWIKGW